MMEIIEYKKIGNKYYIWHESNEIESPIILDSDYVDSLGINAAFDNFVFSFLDGRKKDNQIQKISSMIEPSIKETILLSDSVSDQNVLDVIKKEIGSTIEKTFYTERDRIKVAAIVYIKTNQFCTLEDLKNAIEDGNLINLENFLDIYINHNYNIGRTSDLSFETFRDFIYNTSVDILMEVGD